MDLESLRLAMEAAKAEALAKPDDKDLQQKAADAEKAYNDKKAEEEGEPDESLEDEDKLDEKTKKYLAKIRKESAKHRVKAKDLASQVQAEKERTKAILKAAGVEFEEDKPEEKVKALTVESQTLAFRNAILESAVQHGIPSDQLEFYEFLISKAANDLEEGDELSDEALAEIVGKVKKAGGKKSANSTVDGSAAGGGTGGAPNPGSSGQVTLEKFCSMSMMEKSKLFTSNPSLYTELVTQAKAKKKLV